MSQDVMQATISLRELLLRTNISVNDLNIRTDPKLINSYIISWSTNCGDYEFVAEYPFNINEKFELNNILLNRKENVSAFADDLLMSILYNMGKNNDISPIEFFFHCLCLYWDQVFIDILHAFEFRSSDAMISLKSAIFKNPLAEMDAHKWIKDPQYFIFYITSPSGNRIYTAGNLQQRSDVQRVRNGEIF